MGVTTTNNKPLNPRGNDQSPLAYNRAALYSGKALDFDGVNDYVDAGNNIDIFNSSFTITSHVWVDADTAENSIFESEDNGTYPNHNNILFSAGNNQSYKYRLLIRNYASNQLDIKVTGTIEKNKWHYLTATYDGTTAKVYLNAIEEASGTFSNWTNPIGSVEHNYVGLSAGDRYLNGQIAGFKLFNTALTAAQIADLYNFPEKIVPTGVDNTALKLWLPMMESAGTTAYDGSGNGNHGTINGATYVNGIGAPVAQTSVINWNKGVNIILDSEFTASSTNSPNLFRGFVRNSTTEESPFGTFDAVKMTENGTNGNPALVLNTNGINSSSHKFKVYIKADAATSIAFSTNGQTNLGNVNITTEWQAFEVTQSGANSPHIGGFATITQGSGIVLYVWHPQLQEASSAGPYTPTIGTAQTTPVLLPAGLTTGRDITGVNLFENVRKQGALNLDGQSWAEVHDNASLDYSSEVTLETWIYWTGEDDKGILGRWNGPSGKRSLMLYSNTATKVVGIYSSNGSATAGFLTPSQNLAAGNWYHVAFTSDGSTIKIYIDGVEGNSASYSSGFYVSDENLEIATYQNDQAKAHNGPIAQPRIYNRALSAEEIQRNYNAGKNIYS